MGELPYLEYKLGLYIADSYVWLIYYALGDAKLGHNASGITMVEI